MRQALMVGTKNMSLGLAVVLAVAGCAALVPAHIAWFAAFPTIGLLYAIGIPHG